MFSIKHSFFYFFSSLSSLFLLLPFKLEMNNSDHLLMFMLKLSTMSLPLLYHILLYWLFKKNTKKVQYDLFMVFVIITSDIAIYVNFEIELFNKGSGIYLVTIRTVFLMAKILIFYDFSFRFKLKNAFLTLGIIFQKLKQILLNLLTNSVQFTYTGEITLSLETINFANIKFIIKDTGIGIAPENLEKLIRKLKFVSDDQINETGSCLGLYISEKLITYIGDSEGLMIQSELDKGTQVSFIIDNNLLDDQSNFEIKLRKHKLKTYISLRNSVESCLNRSRSKKSQKNSTIVSRVNTATLQKTKRSTHKTMISSIETVEKVRNPYDFESLIKNAKKRISDRNITMDFTNYDEHDEYRIISKKQNAYSPLERRIKPDFDVSLCECDEILYVDDDAFNLLSLELILKSFHLKCCKLMSGKKAIETLIENSSCGRSKCNKYKLIFLDYQMPLMDGVETTIKIRELMEKNIIKKRHIIGCTGIHSLCLFI